MKGNKIDKGFKELMEKLATYDKYGLKEYKETFIVVTPQSCHY